MQLQINRTPDGTKEHPIHQHQNYEVMLYLSGKGYLRTQEGDYPFEPGTVIVVPPGIGHGSISKDGFCNISISGPFENKFHILKPVSWKDNERGEGKTLALMLYENRYGNPDYLAGLYSAYTGFLLQNIREEDAVTKAVHQVIAEITHGFYDCNLKEILGRSGYAEDYIRAQFKKCTGKTPGTFLTHVRIKQACFLIEIYSGTLSLAQIAERCGYPDYVYFSKRFREVCGVSPRDYKKTCRES